MLALVSALCVTNAASGNSLKTQAGNIAYSGIYREPVRLVDGVYAGKPFTPDGVMRPRVNLLATVAVDSQASASGALSGYALLLEDSGGSGRFTYLAALAESGRGPYNRATLNLGDRVDIVSFLIDGTLARIQLVDRGPSDAACCPTRLFERTYGVKEQRLAMISEVDKGDMIFEALAGTRWKVLNYDRDTRVPGQIAITLEIHQDRIAGYAGCNRYFAAVSSDKPGSLSLGPIGATRKACPPAQMDAERTFLDALQGVEAFTFEMEKLVLRYGRNGFEEVLILRRQQVDSDE